jgi:Ribbon-helix-helix protein, copG family
MAQITLYIDDQIQRRLKEAAARRNVSQSQFVAELIRRATATEWPDEVLALFGSVPDFPLADELRAGLPPDSPRAEW